MGHFARFLLFFSSSSPVNLAQLSFTILQQEYLYYISSSLFFIKVLMLNPLVFCSFVAPYFGPWKFSLLCCTWNNSASSVGCDNARLEVIVRPHLRHLRLERLERELERRARIPNVELLKHARV